MCVNACMFHKDHFNSQHSSLWFNAIDLFKINYRHNLSLLAFKNLTQRRAWSVYNLYILADAFVYKLSIPKSIHSETTNERKKISRDNKFMNHTTTKCTRRTKELLCIIYYTRVIISSWIRQNIIKIIISA